MDIGLIFSLTGIVVNFAVVRYSICVERVIQDQRKLMEKFEYYASLKRTPISKPATIYGHSFKSDEYYKFQHDVLKCFMKVALRRTFFLDQYKPYPVYIRKMHSKNRYKNYYTKGLTLQKLNFYFKMKPLKNTNNMPIQWADTSRIGRMTYVSFLMRQLSIMDKP